MLRFMAALDKAGVLRPLGVEGEHRLANSHAMSLTAQYIFMSS